MKQIKLIGVCLSTVQEEDRFNFIEQLNRHAVKRGYRLLVFNSCADLYEQSAANNQGSSSVFKLIPYERLSALIIFPNIMYDMGITLEVIENCKRYSVPVITMDKEMDDCILFTFSNAEIFRKLCRHVICDHGVRDVFMMAGFKDNIYSEERIRVFKEVLEENGIPFKQENVGYGCFWEQPTMEVMKHWFIDEKRPLPEAIICANDFMAITVSSFIQDMGYRVPGDCIITGFDGIKQTEYLPPNITTCKQDFYTMGRLITETVERLENGEDVKGPFKVDFNIVYSQSCGCKPISYEKASESIRSLILSLQFSDERQKMICSTQAAIPRIAHFSHLPRALTHRYKMATCIFAVNENAFTFDDELTNKNAAIDSFSENVNILYHCYDNVECEQCRIPVRKLIPRYDLMFSREEPVIVCCANYTDMVMGYCVFQPDIDIDEYEKMDSFMGSTSAALGDFHSRMQISNMNQKLVAANDELQKLSQRDFMTGLFNRRGFFDKLDRELCPEKNIGSTLVFVSADLDGLKSINDNYGHAEGDNAIITVGKALLSSSLQSEICARFGGDEFCVAVILNGEDPVMFFEDFKKRFLDYLWDYNRKSGKPYTVRASLGYFSGVIDSNINTTDMIKAADEKMYAYKIAHKRQR